MLDLVLCWATMLPGATIVGRAADCVPRVSPCTQGGRCWRA